MNALSQMEFIEPNRSLGAHVSFEDDAYTLSINDLELRFDFQLDDEELGTSLLIESLNQQYQEMILEMPEDGDEFVNLQSAREWVHCHQDKIAGLYRYLKSLSED